MLREQVAYLQGVIATRDRELEQRSEEIRRRDAALEREQHLAAGFAERLQALGAPAQGGKVGETEQGAQPAAGTSFKEELEAALEGDDRLTSLVSLYAAALPLAIGTGIAAGIANPLLVAGPNNPLWVVVYLLWVLPPIFGFWLGGRVASLQANAGAVASGLGTLLTAYEGIALKDDAMDAFNRLVVKFDIRPEIGPEDDPHYPTDLDPPMRTYLASAHRRQSVLDVVLSLFSGGVGVVTLFSSLGTLWIVTDPGETSEALRRMVGMAIVQGIFAAVFVLFAAFIVLGRARQKREAAHPRSSGGSRPTLLSGNSQALIGLLGTIITAVLALLGVLFQVFYGGGG